MLILATCWTLGVTQTQRHTHPCKASETLPAKKGRTYSNTKENLSLLKAPSHPRAYMTGSVGVIGSICGHRGTSTATFISHRLWAYYCTQCSQVTNHWSQTGHHIDGVTQTPNCILYFSHVQKKKQDHPILGPNTCVAAEIIPGVKKKNPPEIAVFIVFTTLPTMECWGV